MNLKQLFYFLPFLVLFSCNSGTDKWISAAKDSVAQTTTTVTAEEEKQKNAYVTEPPTKDYTGDYLDKYENGNTKFKGFFRFGKRHGQWLAFYANGFMWSECYYDNGMRNGGNTVFYENGKPRYKGWFKKDLRDSVWIFYDAFGVEVKRALFKNDEEVAPTPASK